MSEYRKLTTFEKVCKVFGKIKIPIPKSLEKKFKEEIEFCHFEVTPSEVFSTSLFLPSIFMLLSYFILRYLNLATPDLIASFLMLTIVLFYFLLSYTKFQTIYYRSKLSSEMTLSIIYMAISLQTSKNLERAVSFAANNLTGVLGLDFKRALWNIQSGRSLSISDELSKIAERWKKESEEFVEAISILKNSIVLSEERFQRALSEAVEMVLQKTKGRMKAYGMRLRMPLTLITYFGVLLPLILMVFLPIAALFLPEMIKMSFLSILYTIVLPSAIYFLFRQYFYSRPYSYHQIEFNIEKYRKRRNIVIAITLILLPFLIYKPIAITLQSSPARFKDIHFLSSLLTTAIIGLSIFASIYVYLFTLEKINRKILKFEDELPTATYQLASLCKTGKAIESIFETFAERTKDLQIREIFVEAVEKMKSGLTLEKIISEEGILKNCNSRIIKVVMRSIVDLSKKGTLMVSKALDAIAKFLDDAKEVNKFVDEILDEITSEIKLTVQLFAPICGGVTIGLLSAVAILFSNLFPTFEGMQEVLGKEYKGVFEAMSWVFNLGNVIDLPRFQLVVGIYLLEIIVMMSYFLGEVKYGEDEVSKMKDIGINILIALLIYVSFSLCLYYVMKTIISLSPVGG
ncbi:MAG: hypothetical protein LM587_01290 [Candidatus Aenigmarchaeota archaeon]|nr:hypothetical protein [Candidatus Aenigmarchaeota archaeon]